MNISVSRVTLSLVSAVTLLLSQEPKDQVERSTAGRLNVRVENASLEEVLDAIRPGAGIVITASPQASQQLVSAEVRNASLEEALRVILQGHDTFYMYAVEGQKPAALKAVWVYARGEAKTMQPAAAEALKASKEVEASLRDSDPAVRMRAFNLLLERAGNDAHNALISAVMQERDDGVRGSMIEALHSTGSDLPPELVPTLLNDPSEQIRILTLDSLRGSPNVREFATAALTDSSPYVRSRAQELLDETDQGHTAQE